jgi:hypothetical protein
MMIADVDLTVTGRIPLLDPVLLLIFKVTNLTPVAANVWLGFREVLVPPSPKFHSHEVGLPVDVSVN